MSKYFTKFIYTTLSVLIFNACTVSSSQLNTLDSVIPEPNLQKFYWEATYSNLKYKLIAIDLPKGTLFADRFGNSLYFNGWKVEAIVGFGDFKGEFEIEENNIGYLELSKNNAHSINNDCDNWTSNSFNGITTYTQSCGFDATDNNKVLVNEKGEVIEIIQFIEPSNKLMKIKKLN
tara:strand:- start:86 stop:613 length:528 start_codon:yes stop_codon:yes gene_type:complete